jgi:eukaryotic-like serine/threonine-protein kinase
VTVETNILPPRYADVEQIGRGGMGEIYRARDETLSRTVAVKLLAERFAGDDEVQRRFTREALAAARLSGEPHVVTIFDVGEWNSRPFIVMEHLPGGSLAQVLREHGRVPPERSLTWLEDAARALDAAHAQGVVHRDVKPGNLLLDRNGHVHMADFGVASAVGLDSLTRTGTVLGTAGYLSPEQARGERVTPASDRYGLAVVAYELLSGRRPYENDSPTAEALGHVQAPVPRVSDAHPALPEALDPVFDRALAKEPPARFGSAAQFVAALRDAFAADAETTQRRRAVAATVPPSRRRAAGAGGRRLLPLFLIALLAAGIAGVALAALVAGGDDDPTATPTANTKPRERTVKVTVTTPGETSRVTVTTTTPTPPPPAASPSPSPPSPASPPPASSASGGQLNDQGFRLMQAGRYDEALPLLEQAVAKLNGTSSLTEAYALYNLAYTRLQLGRCEGVAAMLDRSESIQGHRSEIDRARKQAKKPCG